MPLDLWDKSSEDVKERWRDIARTLRDPADAEAVPRALQTCFWFGAQALRTAPGPISEMSLLNLLPPELAEQILHPPDRK
ncbi:MAG TPA: hypothetical protein VML94_05495 [Thermoplasmata archaeon]|nr:hypothetical protein [Thermoplasmata archaeon]